MADVLSTGLSSLRALQRALDTTSHNIANVSTEGYTRQRVEFQTRRPESSAGGWIGTGVDVSTVRRVYDQFLAQQTRTSGTNLARLDAFASQAERIDNLLGDSDNGLSASMQSFTDAINEVSTTPASIPARQVLIAEGRALAERLQAVMTRACATCRPRSTAGSASKRRKSPRSRRASRKLNGEIAVAFQQSGQPPNDLLDQRDALINQLSGKVGVTAVADGDSTLNVFIGNGQPLVLGNAGLAGHHAGRPARSGTHAARPCARPPAPWICRASFPAARSAVCSTGAARCSIRRATSSAASASPSRRR